MARDFQQCGMCDQQSLRSARAYTQSDQSLCLSLEYSMTLKLLIELHLEFLSLKGGCTGLCKSTFVEIPHCWKSHVTARFRQEKHLATRVFKEKKEKHCYFWSKKIAHLKQWKIRSMHIWTTKHCLHNNEQVIQCRQDIYIYILITGYYTLILLQYLQVYTRVLSDVSLQKCTWYAFKDGKMNSTEKGYPQLIIYRQLL